MKLTDNTAPRRFAEALQDQRVVAIIRQSSPVAACEIGDRLLSAGVRLIEVSLVTPGALDVVAALAERAKAYPDSLIGGGTVLEQIDVHRVSNAGGRFILSPIFDRRVVRAAQEQGLSVVPGCATPTEMLEATRLGVDAVKIFPASNWTPRSLRDVLQALPELLCLPTGGVTAISVTDWLDAGAAGVGLGSGMSELDLTGIRQLLASTSGHDSVESRG